MRGIFKAMLLAYVMRKVKNRFMGRGAQRKVYRA